jgi:branched-chain amino acid transport system substrate-binding protein
MNLSHAVVTLGFALTALSLVSEQATAEDTLRIAYMDPFTGLGAASSDEAARTFKFLADRINADGGVAGKKLEIITMDNENNPEKSLIELRKAIDDGISFITQGQSSSVAYALSEAVAKNNKRNPDHPILYIDWSNADPGLTNDSCNFWYFRFDANLEMKMKALSVYMAGQPDVKKVYVINQDYTMGQSVEKAALEMLPKARKDIEIVGTDRVPLGKVKDFSPYVAKIQASGADSVVTGAWGQDLILLLKAASESGLKAKFYTFYGNTRGLTTALGPAAKGIVLVNEWHRNVTSPQIEQMAQDFKDQYKIDFTQWRIALTMGMVSAAMNRAHSTEPLKVALALENMTYQTPMGEARMRADNHQVLEPLFISVLTDGVQHDVENSGLGFKTLRKIDADSTETETTCKMTRPEG